MQLYEQLVKWINLKIIKAAENNNLNLKKLNHQEQLAIHSLAF